MKLSACLLVLGSTAAAANAAIIEAHLTSISPERHMDVSWDGGAHFRTLHTGVNNFLVTGGDAFTAGSTFRGFCIDLNQTISFNASNIFVVTPVENAPVPGGGMGLSDANLLRELWGRYYSLAMSNDQGAAFQSAVWEIVFDSGLNISTGTVQVDGNNTVETLAQAWLDSLNGDTAHFAPVYALTSTGTQDMLVPAPGAFALLGLGALAMFPRRR